MSMALDFSIIVPTYNRPGQLAHCLEVLASLDYPKQQFEIIVVDDGSDVSLDAAISSCSDEIQVTCVRQQNGGPGVARNTGAQSARGTFIAFTDDDCEPAPDWLARLHRSLAENPGAMVGGRTVNALEENPYAATSQAIVDIVYDYYNTDPYDAGFFATNNLALPADGFRELGGFDARFRTSEDRDLCDRWAGSGRRLVYDADAVVRHAHRLTFTSFVRQHFNYGRGARKFYLAHKDRSPGESTLKGSFYRELIRRIPQTLKGKRNIPYLSFMLLAWQIANTAGFLAEVLFPGERQEGGDG